MLRHHRCTRVPSFPVRITNASLEQCTNVNLYLLFSTAFLFLWSSHQDSHTFILHIMMFLFLVPLWYVRTIFRNLGTYNGMIQREKEDDDDIVPKEPLQIRGRKENNRGNVLNDEKTKVEKCKPNQTGKRKYEKVFHKRNIIPLKFQCRHSQKLLQQGYIQRENVATFFLCDKML